jgi:hypothetical protein
MFSGIQFIGETLPSSSAQNVMGSSKYGQQGAHITNMPFGGIEFGKNYEVGYNEMYSHPHTFKKEKGMRKKHELDHITQTAQMTTTLTKGLKNTKAENSNVYSKSKTINSECEKLKKKKFQKEKNSSLLGSNQNSNLPSTPLPLQKKLKSHQNNKKIKLPQIPPNAMQAIQAMQNLQYSQNNGGGDLDSAHNHTNNHFQTMCSPNTNLTESNLGKLNGIINQYNNIENGSPFQNVNVHAPSSHIQDRNTQRSKKVKTSKSQCSVGNSACGGAFQKKSSATQPHHLHQRIIKDSFKNKNIHGDLLHYNFNDLQNINPSLINFIKSQYEFQNNTLPQNEQHKGQTLNMLSDKANNIQCNKYIIFIFFQMKSKTEY